jgi:hypothetical protein
VALAGAVLPAAFAPFPAFGDVFVVSANNSSRRLILPCRLGAVPVGDESPR